LLLLLGGVDHDRCRLDRWRVLRLSWIVCSRIGRVFSRASSRIEACCTAGHRILLSRWHIWGPVLSRGDEVALRGASKRELLLGNHHHLGAGWVDMSGSNRSRPTTCLDSRSTGGHSRSVLIVTLSGLWCGVHLWRWRCCKNKRRGLSRSVGGLCQSWGRGWVWDRGGSRYRLWWFVHFTFFYGSALGWRCVASLSGINCECVVKMGTRGESASGQSSVYESSRYCIFLVLYSKRKVMPFLAIDLAR